ncbi:DUF6894 family protein [Methylobacterium oxalidis]|uniref:DUF6894 domain-containing protein n=1 Tax=Methylobacterium oxalidis TaxID=944322 RepID=A0A512J4V9_9HYPH|nr:hypothetical protein [Methylobacterium oxalidis]GEP04950.1 hypothetical protein MOX02_29880 [Methylobacterium oxalidis]GJE34190.1 hypothetical protein LDDCCGHA_4397 [Methylobacterium oxalidis]GLS63687.1 hypothetical protein GCM10007888_20680 [Methylobacterium oxalidis]
MAQRFHFDLTDGYRTLRDRAGTLAPDVDRALAQALMAIKELRDSGELATLGDGWQMVVRDTSGTVRQVFLIQ